MFKILRHAKSYVMLWRATALTNHLQSCHPHPRLMTPLPGKNEFDAAAGPAHCPPLDKLMTALLIKVTGNNETRLQA